MTQEELREEALEYKHLNPAMKNFGLVCVTMMFIGLLVVTGIVVFNELAGSLVADPLDLQQTTSSEAPSN